VNKGGGAFTIICAFIALYAGGSGLMVEEMTPVRFPLGVIPVVIRTAMFDNSASSVDIAG
jgi:hypothetical protein